MSKNARVEPSLPRNLTRCPACNKVIRKDRSKPHPETLECKGILARKAIEKRGWVRAYSHSGVIARAGFPVKYVGIEVVTYRSEHDGKFEQALRDVPYAPKRAVEAAQAVVDQPHLDRWHRAAIVRRAAKNRIFLAAIQSVTEMKQLIPKEWARQDIRIWDYIHRVPPWKAPT